MGKERGYIENWKETFEASAAHGLTDYRFVYWPRSRARWHIYAVPLWGTGILLWQAELLFWSSAEKEIWTDIHNRIIKAKNHNVWLCTRSALEMLLELYRLVTNLFVSLDQSRMMINFKQGAPTEIHIPANKNSLSQIDSISGIELSNCVSRWANASCLRLTSVNPRCLRWRFFCISDAK